MNKSLKIPSIHSCVYCNYNTSSYKDYNKHLITRKHYNRTILNDLELENPNKSPYGFKCHCGKEYSARNSLWYHKKKCDSEANKLIETKQTTHHEIDHASLTEKMIELVMSKNQDFMNLFMDKIVHLLPNVTNTNCHNTNNNNHFNIQMFLNQHCKNAMNISDFIKSLPITAQHYENTKDHGLTDTLTNIIVDGLNNLDIDERPIHCTDKKRKVIYVKDNDIWEKDDNNNLILKNLKALSAIHGMNLYIWQDDNPKYETVEKLQLEFADIISNLYTNIFQERKHVNKIINNLSNSTYLDDDDKLQYSNYDTLTSL